MSPFESSDVLSVAFSQNFDFYQLNVVAVVDVAAVQFAIAIAIAIAKFDAAAALLLFLFLYFFSNAATAGYDRRCQSISLGLPCWQQTMSTTPPSPNMPPLPLPLRRVSMSVCLLCAIMIGIISSMPWKMKMKTENSQLAAATLSLSLLSICSSSSNIIIICKQQAASCKLQQQLATDCYAVIIARSICRPSMSVKTFLWQHINKTRLA